MTTNYSSHTLHTSHACFDLIAKHLIQTPWRGHGGLDGQAAHILPALLQQRDEVVDGKHDVSDQLILRHVHVADRDTHAQHLLQLELDRGLDFGDFRVEIFRVGDWGWELAGCENKLVLCVMRS